jgi:hypothetical protein
MGGRPLNRAFPALLAFLPLALSGCPARRPTTPTPENAVPLNSVIAQVESALVQYQDNIGNGPPALPPLSSAEFDFKVTTGRVTTTGINLLIFKIGGSYEYDVVHELTFTYAVPKPKVSITALGPEPPKQLKETLASTIQSAAAAVKTSRTAAGLPFKNLTMIIQYGVKWEGSITASGPISFVTASLGGTKNRNAVQSLKLVFDTGS